METLTFVGGLDVEVERFPFGAVSGAAHEASLDALLRHALFGYPVIIHTGFLFHSLQLRNLVETNSPVLAALIRHGRIRLLSETGDIIEDEKIKIDVGVPTSVQRGISEDDKFRYGDVSRLVNLSIGGRGAWIENKEQYRASSNSVRLKIMNDICGNGRINLNVIRSSEYQIDRVAEEFLEHSKRLTPRSAWLRALADTFGDNYFNQNATFELMDVANEIFHSSHALAVANLGVEYDIRLETIYTNRLRNYVAFKPESVADFETYNISIPTSLIIEKCEDFFDELYDTSSYLSLSRQAYLAAKGSGDVARSYERALLNWFGISQTPEERADEIAFQASVGMAATGVLVEIILEKYRRKAKGDALSSISRRRFLTATVWGLAGAVGVKIYQPQERATTWVARRVADHEFAVHLGELSSMVESSLPENLAWPYYPAKAIPTVLSNNAIDAERSNEYISNLTTYEQ